MSAPIEELPTSPEKALEAWAEAEANQRHALLRRLPASAFSAALFQLLLEERLVGKSLLEALGQNREFQGVPARAAAGVVLERLWSWKRGEEASGPAPSTLFRLLRLSAERGGFPAPQVEELAERVLIEPWSGPTAAWAGHSAALLVGFPGLDEVRDRHLLERAERYLAERQRAGPFKHDLADAFSSVLQHPDVSYATLQRAAGDSSLASLHDALLKIPRVQQDERCLRAMFPHLGIQSLVVLCRHAPVEMICEVIKEIGQEYPMRTANILRELRPEVFLPPEVLLPLLTSSHAELRLAAGLVAARGSRPGLAGEEARLTGGENSPRIQRTKRS